VCRKAAWLELNCLVTSPDEGTRVGAREIQSAGYGLKRVKGGWYSIRSEKKGEKKQKRCLIW